MTDFVRHISKIIFLVKKLVLVWVFFFEPEMFNFFNMSCIKSVILLSYHDNNVKYQFLLCRILFSKICHAFVM